MTGSKAFLMLLMVGTIGLVGGVVGRSVAYAADGLNACGCREGSTPGLCYCEKKSRCGCPGECEPKGCDERRAKQMEKEIQAETRKAEDATKKAEEAARRQRPRESDEPSEERRDERRNEEQANPRGSRVSAPPPAPRKPKIVRMTPAQKRSLAKLIGAYLAEHPDQGGKAIDQVKTEVSR